MAEDNNSPVVIDSGSNTVKACFAGDDAPRVVFPCVLGNPRHHGMMVGMDQFTPYVGDYALRMRGILSLKYPVRNGIVAEWDNIERVWSHAFYRELCVQPEEHPVLLTETPDNPKENREKMAQIMFETFNVPSLYISNSAVLSLYSAGRSTGLVIESGLQCSRVVPVYKCHSLTSCALTLDIGGQDLVWYIMKLLSESGFSLCGGSDTEILNDIKEKLGYVALDPEKEMLSRDSSRFYELPDGQKMSISDQRFRCVEPLFQPNLIGNESVGIHKLAHNCIMKCDVDVRRHLSGNILLSGGNTAFPGMAERIQKEVTLLSPTLCRINVTAPPERQYGVCMGGSMLTSMTTFSEMSLSKDCYDEWGPMIIHRKCF